ncbi:MAG: alpha/beta hydrolase-fold protein [Acidobacteriota bacterium]
MRRGRIEREALVSEVLVGNPQGDPHVRPVPVYLPPGYDEDGDRRFPVVYLLAGFAGRGEMMLNDAVFGESIAERMDRLIAAGCGEAILVLPDCSTRWGGSQYVDSSANGDYERHLADEIVPWVDERYRTLPGARAVAGKSSGGFGALSLLMRRPGLFRAGCCHSGDMVFEHCYQRDFADATDILGRHGGVEGFLAHLQAVRTGNINSIFKAINIVGMASCYSPDADRPGGFALPFDEATGLTDHEVWERWLRFDPWRLVEEKGDALKNLALLLIDCGNRDEYALHVAARVFVARLKELGIAHEYEEFDGGHFGTSHRYDWSLPKIVNALGTE